jgi:hypothetical protein
MVSRPNGICEECGVTTCRIGLSNCLCQVGYPYELQCHDCRNRKDRIDNGYCVCTPVKTPPRSIFFASGLGEFKLSSGEAKAPR